LNHHKGIYSGLTPIFRERNVGVNPLAADQALGAFPVTANGFRRRRFVHVAKFNLSLLIHLREE